MTNARSSRCRLRRGVFADDADAVPRDHREGGEAAGKVAGSTSRNRREKVLVHLSYRSARAQRCLFYYAANTAFQTAGVLLSLRRIPPRLNWPL
jgi:hypothetical protein